MAQQRYLQTLLATITLGSAAGRTFTLTNGGPALLNAARIGLTTTATVGNRLLKIRVLDVANNVLFEHIDPNNVAGSGGAGLNWAAGVAAAISGITHVMPLPANFMVPVGAQINVFDSANIDVADTINAVVSMSL
jgi:hypothetical protein